MSINKTEELLHKFDYKFERKNNDLIVKLSYSQRLIIDFSEPQKVKIKDKLVGWNFLTGMIEMSIKNATLYNFIGVIIVTIAFIILDSNIDALNLLFIYLALLFWLLLWNIYYLIKAENLRRTLMSWNC